MTVALRSIPRTSAAKTVRALALLVDDRHLRAPTSYQQSLNTAPTQQELQHPSAVSASHWPGGRDVDQTYPRFLEAVMLGVGREPLCGLIQQSSEHWG